MSGPIVDPKALTEGATINGSPPRVLFVYFTYTNQTRKIVEAMTETFQQRGCEVERAAIELTDTRYAARFREFPMPHPLRELVGMIPAELRRTTAEIGIPDAARAGAYDLVCIGSPTWWLSTSVPIRSYLESDAARPVLRDTPSATVVVCRRYYGHNLRTVKKLTTRLGAKYVDGVHFAYQGGQIRSLLSLLSYLGSGEYRKRYLGVPIPPTNIQDAQLEAARTFASELADRLGLGTPARAEQATAPITDGRA